MKEKVLPFDCELRRVKYLNNAIEQDHRAVRRRWRAMQCFRSFHTAERTIEGIEAMHVMRKGQVKRLDGRDAGGQSKFIATLFGVPAWSQCSIRPSLPQINLCNANSSRNSHQWG